MERKSSEVSSPDSMVPNPAHSLVSWYEQHARALPWRQTQDPYRILVSETMLQQTRVEAVIPYYYAFLERFPTVRDLALAEEDAVLKQWQGLGYYSRARNLQRAARTVYEQHEGNIPCEEEALRNLPGVGDYTTGAVMSIAFNQPVPAVDGNVLRVITRVFGIAIPIDKPAAKRAVRDIVQAWLDVTEPRVLTQALMELGALVCVPKSPRCSDCPLVPSCVAYRDQTTDQLPVRPAKKARKLSDVLALWLEIDGHILVEKRPAEGLLAGLWQLPSVMAEPNGSVSPSTVLSKLRSDAWQSQHSLVREGRGRGGVGEGGEDGSRSFALLAEEHHIFTHLEWQVKVYRPIGIDEPCRSLRGFGIMDAVPPLRWVPKAELKHLAWPRVYEKILASLLGPEFDA